MRNLIQILFLACLLPTISNAQYHFEYDAVSEAYDDIVNLEFEAAQATLDSIQATDADNLAVLHLENYIDFFTLFIYERDADFKLLRQRIKQRQSHLRKLKYDSPYAAFVEAEMLLQGALAKSKFDELLSSAKDIYQAFGILKDGKERYPDFVLFNKSLSVIHALAETIPLSGMIKDIMGINGNLTMALNEINELLYTGSDELFRQEAEVVKTFLILYQANKPEQAWQYYKTTDVSASETRLAKFVSVKIAQRANRNDAALEILSTLTDTDYRAMPYLSFLHGLSTLRQLDATASEHFERFLEYSEGRHFIKEAYQKLAWAELIFNDNVAAYKSRMRSCIEQGRATVDDDKQALTDAQSDQIPHPILLKARLLFDGGYYQKAHNTLIKNAHLFYVSDGYRAEYLYRIGRITQQLLNYRESLEYYKMILDEPKYVTTFYACNAALQSGIIYEKQRQNDTARQFFELCLSLDPDKYKHSLHQKAKSGLVRTKE